MYLAHFVKRCLRCKYYLRYVDDFILVDPSKDQLLTWERDIETFCWERLLLRIKEENLLRRVGDGADFLGYVVRPTYSLARRRVVQNLKRRLSLFQQRMIRPFAIGNLRFSQMTLNPEIMDELRQVLASYLGHFKHADTKKLVNIVIKKMNGSTNFFFWLTENCPFG